MNVEDSKPWYLSKGVLAPIAAILMVLGMKLGLLPATVTDNDVVNALVVIVPILVGLYGRVTATHKITG